MNFKVGDNVVIRQSATEEQLDNSDRLRPGMTGTVIEVTKSTGLDILVQWPNDLFWWVSKNALELYSKDLTICDKVKTMYERQPYFQKMKTLEVKIPEKKKLKLLRRNK